VQRLLALFLLACIVSFHFGYYLTYVSQSAQLERDWEVRIYDKPGAASGEMSIKIPLSVAYMPDQDDFRESNSVFQKEGCFFRVIKQRYQKDTLELVYVPDREKDQLRQSLSNWAQTISPYQTDQSTGIQALKPRYPDYRPAFRDLWVPLSGTTLARIKPWYAQTLPSSGFYGMDFPPPELFSLPRIG